MPPDPKVVTIWWVAMAPPLSFLVGAILMIEESISGTDRPVLLTAAAALMGLPATYIMNGYFKKLTTALKANGNGNGNGNGSA